ncbi:hypothetical protein LR48_Vigan03g147600 [Vigna angularis]|uniref:Uncharacterized protein n=1 Tax=Phaseolus angularis TaxID=3914 RepID=A0A0L9U6N4_PHAAN|nr:hypothetical protein LR48_Vigan03g147600 [Vigna angularis]
MAEAPHSSRDEVPTSRPTRGATMLRQLILRRNAGGRTLVIIDVVTGVASGPNADVFRSYIRVLARDRISILTSSFDHVSETDRNLIWQDLLAFHDNAQALIECFLHLVLHLLLQLPQCLMTQDLCVFWFRAKVVS